MRKRTKVLIAVVAAILILTIGITATAFAQDSSGDEGKAPMQTFISKVASILGLEEQQVADAFKQARQEMQDEALEQRLQEAVESGCITEEEADQIRGWWQNRPEALEKFCPLGRFQLGKARCHQRPPVYIGCHQGLSQIFDERLNGTITDVTEGAITLTTEDGNSVTFEYTSNTVFILRGLTTIESGQKATAWCWEDAAGSLTAKIVQVGLP